MAQRPEDKNDPGDNIDYSHNLPRLRRIVSANFLSRVLLQTLATTGAGTLLSVTCITLRRVCVAGGGGAALCLPPTWQVNWQSPRDRCPTASVRDQLFLRYCRSAAHSLR